MIDGILPEAGTVIRRGSSPTTTARSRPEGVRQGDPVGGRGDPRLVGGSADLAPSNNTLIEERRRRAGKLRRPQPPLRRPRARDGARRQRPQPPRLPRLQRHLPDLLRLHEGLDAARGPVADPVDLRLHPRLDRPGRGRSDLRADRAPHPPRDPEPVRGPAADANETVLAWRFAIEQTESPVALALTCQGLPILDPETIPLDAVERGAYVLRDSGGDPDLIWRFSTGSEVALCPRRG